MAPGSWRLAFWPHPALSKGEGCKKLEVKPLSLGEGFGVRPKQNPGMRLANRG